MTFKEILLEADKGKSDKQKKQLVNKIWKEVDKLAEFFKKKAYGRHHWMKKSSGNTLTFYSDSDDDIDKIEKQIDKNKVIEKYRDKDIKLYRESYDDPVYGKIYYITLLVGDPKWYQKLFW